MKVSRRDVLATLSATLAMLGLYTLLTPRPSRKSYNKAASTESQHMKNNDNKKTLQTHLHIEDKGEVVGNLIAAKLKGRGVEFFTYGEYFEAEPLLQISDPNITVIKQWWNNGVSYRTISINGANVEEKLIAYHDTLAYVIRNISETRPRIRIDGAIQVFSWFMPQSREKIAELAGSKFEHRQDILTGSYSNNGPFITIKSSHKIEFKRVEKSHSSYSAEISLAPDESFVLSVAGHQSAIEESKKEANKILYDPDAIEDAKKKEVVKLIDDAARKHQVKPEYELFSRYMWYVILSNRVHVDTHPVLNHPFVMPSKFGLRHQWLWDSAFHAIVLSKYNVKMAEEEILNLFNAQKKDGRIPHEIFLSKEFCQIFWKVDDYAPWTTQPPVLAIAVDEVIGRGGDKRFAERAYESLDRYDKWFRNQRDKDNDQLMAYVDYLESGWDNSMRWDEPQRLFNDNPEKYLEKYEQIRMAPVEAIDLNCLIYLQRKTLSKIAKNLGLENDAEKYQQLAETTAKRVRELMWDEETDFYYDIYEEEHKIIGVKTPAAFLTLYAGIATQQQAEKLVKHLLHPKEFWTLFPLPTVSADNPNYDPEGYWRGRSWINIAWFTYHGLRRYGYQREATALAQRVADIMSQKPSCNENYNSQTGEPLGAPDFGWSTLALDFLTR